jgi:hypothetical protein
MTSDVGAWLSIGGAEGVVVGCGFQQVEPKVWWHVLVWSGALVVDAIV